MNRFRRLLIGCEKEVEKHNASLRIFMDNFQSRWTFRIDSKYTKYINPHIFQFPVRMRPSPSLCNLLINESKNPPPKTPTHSGNLGSSTPVAKYVPTRVRANPNNIYFLFKPLCSFDPSAVPCLLCPHPVTYTNCRPFLDSSLKM